jgi:lysine biosynthesis protein LysW
MINCPGCKAAIDVDEEELDEGDALICEECGKNLNVTGISPLELSIGEDDDDDDDDDDDLDDDDDYDDADDDDDEEADKDDIR